MRILIASSLCIMLLGACTEKNAETSPEPAAVTSSAETSATAAVSDPVVSTDSSAQSAISENQEQGSWTGQIAVAQPVSMFNYVGAESGDFAPMRFQNDSEVGRKILAACSDGDMCEFTGVIEWLDEAPPPDASAIGRIVRVDSVKRSTRGTP